MTPSSQSGDEERVNEIRSASMTEPDAYGLYPIDRRIISLIARGQFYGDIAKELQWGYRTVSVRVHVLCQKLGVSGRAELIQWAQKHL